MRHNGKRQERNWTQATAAYRILPKKRRIQRVVFYNGTREMPKERVLKLPDAFENKEAKADAELAVRVPSINHGHSKLLMEKRRALEEHARLAAKARDCMAAGKDMQAALNKAINGCIGEGIRFWQLNPKNRLTPRNGRVHTLFKKDESYPEIRCLAVLIFRQSILQDIYAARHWRYSIWKSRKKYNGIRHSAQRWSWSCGRIKNI